MPRTNPFPTDNVVEKLAKSARAARQEFADYERPIKPADRRRMAHPRPGSDKVLTHVLDVASQMGINLPTMPIASIREAQAAGARIRPLLSILLAFHQSVADTAFTAESTAWSGGMIYYTVLSRLAEHNEHLRAALQPATDFFARRSSSVREEQTVARAERKAEKATKKAAEAKKAAELVKARRAEAQPVPAAARDGGNGVA